MFVDPQPKPAPWPETILQHLARYRLTVPAALRAAVPCRREERSTRRRALAKLERVGLVHSAPLYGDRAYWALTAAGWARLGGDPATEPLIGTPFSEEAKLRQYALLSFCCLGRTPRRRLLAQELQPEPSEPELSRRTTNYYVEATAAGPRMGWVRVDVSGHGRWDRILAKVRHDAEQQAADPRFQALMAAGRFEITLVTALLPKALRLRAALAEMVLPLPIHVVTVPDLLLLIAPPPLPRRPRTSTP